MNLQLFELNLHPLSKEHC